MKLKLKWRKLKNFIMNKYDDNVLALTAKVSLRAQHER